MSRINRTARHLLASSPKRGYDGVEAIPRELAESPTFVHRLGFKLDGPSQMVRDQLAENIAQTPSEVAYFIDTNIWDRALEDEVWRVLLDRPDGVHIVPSVRVEVESWLTRNPDYIGTRALRNQESALVLHEPYEQGSADETAWAYYVYLLQIRRMMLSYSRDRFQEREKRDPTPGELSNEVQRSFGERGLALVRKNRMNSSVDKYATDESLVYIASKHALDTGRPTVILTKDNDIQEQFYKLCWFLDTHYRAMLLAREYLADPFRYRVRGIPESPMRDRLFDSADGILIDSGSDRMRAVLPATFDFVPIECWVIAHDAVTRLAFGAETQMHELLEIKGSTGGLVSSQLQGRNLHPYLLPLSLDPHSLRDCMAIVRDKTIPVSSTRARVGMFDITHSINTNERFTRLVSQDEISSSRLWVPTTTRTSRRARPGIPTIKP